MLGVPGIDLHTHTDRSDGTFAPSEVVRLAAERGLDVVAITDHDTTDGLEEAADAGERAGVEVVPGVELSAEHDGRSVHVLAYWIDVANDALQDELRRLRDHRLRRAELIVERLAELGVPIRLERVLELARGGNVVRPHLAQALVEAGHVASEEEAFERWIGDGGPAHAPKHALAPVDAVRLIRDAGGVSVLAHPGMWEGETPLPYELIERMSAAGMAGLEVDHTDHTPEDRERYRALAGRLGLVATGGSDCHGLRYDPIRLGGALCRPDDFVALRARAGAISR
jgi:predicted metal-dependent phosphoesterase TrpH